jgi:hypothetical protein
LGVEAVVPVKVGDGAGLPKMLDAECPRPVAVHAAEPGQRRGMTVTTVTSA